MEPEGVQNEVNEQPTRRSTRAWQPTQRILESMQQKDMALPMCLQAAVYDTEYETIITTMYDDDYFY